MDIQHYISSGVLEAYLLGIASEEEQHEVQQMQMLHPEISSALNEIEVKIESYCLANSVPPPPGSWELIASKTTRKELKKRHDGDYSNNGYATTEPKTEKPDY